MAKRLLAALYAFLWIFGNEEVCSMRATSDDIVVDEDLAEIETDNVIDVDERAGGAWLTNRQIRNKFIRQWNLLKKQADRIAGIEAAYEAARNAATADIVAAETDIGTVQTHENDISTSFQQKCDRFHTLLTGTYECCHTDLIFSCDTTLIAGFAGYDTTKCAECPDSVISG